MTIAAGRTRGRAGADFSPPFFLSLLSPLFKLPRRGRYYHHGFDYRVYSELESAVNKSATSPRMESHCEVLSPHIRRQPLFYRSPEC